MKLEVCSPTFSQIREQFEIAAHLAEKKQLSFVRSEDNLKVGTKKFEKTRNPIDVAKELNVLVWKDTSYSTIKADLEKIECENQKKKNERRQLPLLSQTKKALQKKREPKYFMAKADQNSFLNTLHRDINSRLRWQHLRFKDTRGHEKNNSKVLLVDQIKLEGQQFQSPEESRLNQQFKEFVHTFEKEEREAHSFKYPVKHSILVRNMMQNKYKMGDSDMMERPDSKRRLKGSLSLSNLISKYGQMKEEPKSPFKRQQRLKAVVQRIAKQERSGSSLERDAFKSFVTSQAQQRQKRLLLSLNNQIS